jgi:hypothetical protein
VSLNNAPSVTGAVPNRKDSAALRHKTKHSKTRLMAKEARDMTFPLVSAGMTLALNGYSYS